MVFHQTSTMQVIKAIVFGTKNKKMQKKKIINYILFLSILISLPLLGKSANNQSISNKNWHIAYAENKTFTFRYKGKDVLQNVSVRAKVGEDIIESKQYNVVKIKNESINDAFGKGQKYTISYTDNKQSKVNIDQVFYFYSHKDYFLSEVFLTSGDDISTNYIAPIYTTVKNSFLPQDQSNRILRVPFDNDAFVHYLSSPLTGEDTSFEVTSIFNGQTRNGLVLGSVEHDVWKTGIQYKTTDNQYITELECFGGVTHELTRDISNKEDRPSCPHGSIKGKSLKSPKIFVGMFDDWRRGMETFADANALIAPPRKWHAGTPFGWNSWGAMADKVNYEGATDVSDFIKNELETNNFKNDSTVYIGLDSFWDNFTEEQLKQFVEHCKANGQKAGIYWCPFSDWYANAEAYVEGTNNKWKYSDIYLYTNGKPRKIESLAVDPTHEGTKQRMVYYINKFKKLGFSYVKLDFLNNGTLEADSFYNKQVTTGTQAYNEGMHYLSELCGEDMFMALSIAPSFPSQYGTSKRISCDTWGAMTEGDWGTTGYMLNSLSFGWWLDRVYAFNDADHILLYNPKESADYGTGANRARITSAVITGIYMLGDNFSLKGRLPGNEQARDKAKAVTTNKQINEIARLGTSFYPVEGYKASDSAKAEKLFMLETKDCVYLAVFNFDKEKNMTDTIRLSRLSKNITGKNLVTELWTSENIPVANGSLPYSVPTQDVRVYKIIK